MRQPLAAVAAGADVRPTEIVRRALRHFFQKAVEAGALPAVYMPEPGGGRPRGRGRHFRSEEAASDTMSIRLAEFYGPTKLFAAEFGVPASRQTWIVLAAYLLEICQRQYPEWVPVLEEVAERGRDLMPPRLHEVFGEMATPYLSPDGSADISVNAPSRPHAGPCGVRLKSEGVLS